MACSSLNVFTGFYLSLSGHLWNHHKSQADVCQVLASGLGLEQSTIFYFHLTQNMCMLIVFTSTYLHRKKPLNAAAYLVFSPIAFIAKMLLAELCYLIWCSKENVNQTSSEN